MATLLLTAVGTIFGGPIGGALGALVGRQVDSAIIGGRSSEGPRLKELSVQTSSYGSALPLHFGKMRAAGTVIWSTELVEHREKHGGGKGRPSVTTYSYSASFAVAIASRPVAAIGRVWADGNLLRGAAGDLKVGGTMRLYPGHGGQEPDPLLVQAEGAGRCPAFRNTAYVVFEDLELADFGNRLPSLTFEILADEAGTSPGAIVSELAPEADVSGLSRPIGGFSVDRGTVADVLATLDAAFPVACNAWGETLAIGAVQAVPPAMASGLPEPASARDDSEPGHKTGESRHRASQPRTRACSLRYYDLDRDFQPGIQRGRGRAGSGELAVIELPAALAAADALIIADAVSRRNTMAAETARYRIAALDARFGPGKIVTMPGRSGTWRVDQWEWQADGVNLLLTRLPPAPFGTATIADPGRANIAADLANAATLLAAFELPWDGAGSGDAPAIYVAASASSAGWSGAALFASQPGGVLASLGSTGRRRAALGTTVGALPFANPLLIDRASTVEVELAAADLGLADADFTQLAAGANRALIGAEIVQFASADPLGGRRWRLSGFLRGRGGTEDMAASHVAGETFVLLDDRIIAIDPLVLGDAATAGILATGLGDLEPVVAAVSDAGATRRPLRPVHGRAMRAPDGDIALAWTRRARGAWRWLDHVDAPLNEQAEAWEVILRDGDVAVHRWTTAEPWLRFASGLVRGEFGTAHLEIRQIGTAGASRPLVLPIPA